LPQLRGAASHTMRNGGKSRPSDSRAELQFDDNRLLADLLGEFDAHLSLLEERLGVQAVVHGNVVLLEGSESGCELARGVLEELYARLKSGQSVGTGDIDGAIRHARAGVKLHKTEDGGPEVGQLRTRKRVVSARTPMQTAYMQALQSGTLTFGTGPAGTGKTYLAVAYAAGCLERGEVERIILSRPAVEAGERLGFLPGDMREKVDPYLRPLYDALYDVLPPEKVERGLDTGIIEIAPLAFMRGRTLAHACAILDEAQNCTSMQMKMFLTRLGEGSKMIVTGDPSQVDLPLGQTSGLQEAITILGNVKGIAHIPFTAADVVRHELVARIVEAYEKAPLKR
jgi:phosphate starvation-inducible protein PhoH and related proteins